MVEFLFAYLVFLLTHALPTRPPVRRRLVAALGERPFQLAYSLLSLALLWWLIVAARDAPYVGLWPPALWQWYATLALMPVAFVLMGIGVGVANALSISLWPVPDDWAPSGVVRAIRHPLLAGLALWGAAHALPNGDLVLVLLFGGLAVFAIAGMAAVERRRRAELGDARFAAIATRRGYRDTRRQALAAALGLSLFAVLLVLHPALFGVDPLAAIIG